MEILISIKSPNDRGLSLTFDVEGRTQPSREVLARLIAVLQMLKPTA